LAPVRRALSLLAFAAACGGTNSADLFSNSNRATDGGTTKENEPDSSPSDDASTATDGGKGKDAGKKPDAAALETDASTEAGGGDAGTDAGETDAGPTDPGIFCGTDGGARSYCSVTTEYCCAVATGGDPDFSCLPESDKSCGGVSVPCSDDADCNGKICCGTYSHLTGSYDAVQCKTSCSTDNATITEYRLCDPELSPDPCVAGGETCKASQAMPGWYICSQ
jgi:hypothetical protein